MSDNVVLWSIADDLRGLAVEIENFSTVIQSDNAQFPKRGTIVRARSSQARFKPTSMWVSNGDGSYTHITGKKFLTTNHNRLDGFVDTIYTA
jgi:hypothetical protein